MQNRWTVVYYHNRRGEELARNEIKAFGPEVYAKILTVIGLLKDYGLNIPSRFVKHVEDKIWEIKVDRYRVLYFAFRNRRFVVLRTFIKKTDKTPRREITIAWNRLQDYSEWSEETTDEEN